jgi:hypothetical protein
LLQEKEFFMIRRLLSLGREINLCSFDGKGITAPSNFLLVRADWTYPECDFPRYVSAITDSVPKCGIVICL